MINIHQCELFQRNIPSSGKKVIQNFIDSFGNREFDDAKNLLIRRTLLPTLFTQRVHNYRIIIEHIDIDTIPVFCIRTIFIRSDPKYDELINEPENWISRYPLTEAEINKIKKDIEKRKKEEEISKKLTEIPEDLRKWLEQINLSEKTVMVYESGNWIEGCNQKYFRSFWKSYYELLQKIITKDMSRIKIEPVKLKNNDREIKIASFKDKDDYKIVYEYITSPDRNPMYFLYLHSDDSLKNINEIVDNYNLNKPLKDLDFQKIISLAKRAYPEWLFADDDGKLWREIQYDEKANLSLSAEEESLLEEVNLPLFINGQAGSGKSTMLFYLFSLYCFHKIRNNWPKDPIFLTYNSQLLDVAKESVKSILRVHPNYAEYGIPLDKVDKFFYPFQEFILKELLNDKDRLNFRLDNYIGFTRFRQFYTMTDVPNEDSEKTCRLPQRSNFSAELAWHVIRTYIKGYSQDKYLMPEEYSNIPRDDKSVSDDNYQGIYMIWERWYKKLYEEHKLWDDQDLIRFALEKWDKKNKNFPLIFCDEAQDFTKTELELLLRLSEFTQYDLSKESCIPFAFAGDPFQTVNPTGFSWERLKDIFTEKLKSCYFDSILNFTELKQNYRSIPEIVSFANLIQYYRYLFLDKKELEPQNCWLNSMPENIPCKFMIETIRAEDLSEAENTIIIVPAETGMEKEFIEKEKFLKEKLKLSDGQQIFKNIFSSGSAKGLEFDRVIIYKFGEELDNIMQRLIDIKDNGKKLDENENIKIAYFFNKLYVAITRAKQKLIIIDSKKGDKNLWKYFEEKNYYNKNISDKDKEKWDEKIGFIIDGNPQNIGENIKEREPREIAEELEKVGIERNEPELLERAAKYYEGLNENKNTLKCQARALYLKQKWYEAGLKYEELGEISEASNCFWKGQNWYELFILHENHTKIKWKIRYEVSEFMLDTKVDYTQILRKEVLDEIEGEEPSEKTWVTVVKELKHRLENIKFETRVPEYGDKEGSLPYGKNEQIYLKIAAQLKKLAGFGFEFLWDLAAEYYFKGKDYNEAIECWEKLENITSSSYYKAKACNISEINQKINWLNRMPWENEIIKEWRYALNREEYSITDNTAAIILRALKRNKLFQDAFNVSVRHNFIKESLEIYKEYIHNQESNTIKDECSNKLLDALFTQHDWKKYTDIWNKLLLDLSDEFILKTVDKMLEKIGEDANILFDVINYSTWVKISEDNLNKLETEEIFIIDKHSREKLNNEQLNNIKFTKYAIVNTEEINKMLKKAEVKSEDIQTIKDITKFVIPSQKLKKVKPLLERELLKDKLIEKLTQLTFSKYEIDVILRKSKPVDNDKIIYIKNKFLKTISKSDTTPLDFTIRKRKELDDFINEILYSPQVYDNFNLSEIGSAMERVSDRYTSLLPFYEKIMEEARNKKNDSLERWAKVRWLVIKRKYGKVQEEKVEIMQKQKKSADSIAIHYNTAQKIKEECKEKIESWNIKEEDLLDEFPKTLYDVIIEGLPPGVTLNKNERQYNFQLNHLNIALFNKDKKIFLADMDRGESINIFAESKTINSDNAEIKQTEKGDVHFIIRKSDISGTIEKENQVILNISEQKIKIKFV